MRRASSPRPRLSTGRRGRSQVFLTSLQRRCTSRPEVRRHRHRSSGGGPAPQCRARPTRTDDESEHYPMTTTFAGLGVPADLVAALARRGHRPSPSPSRQLTIADALAGRDVSARPRPARARPSPSACPLLERIGKAEPRHPHGLVLVPTRELATQVTDGSRRSARSRGRRCVAVYGGVVDGPADRRAAARASTSSSARPAGSSTSSSAASCRSRRVEVLVVDEADRMADMGFMPQVQKILYGIEGEHQTMLFSATLDGAVKRLVDRYMHDPVSHEVDDRRAHRRRDGPPLPARPPDGQGEGRGGDRQRRRTARSCSCAPSAAPTGSSSSSSARACRPARSTATCARAHASRRSPTSRPARSRCSSPPTSRPAASTSTASTSSSTTTRPRTTRPTSTARAAPPAPGRRGVAVTLMLWNQENEVRVDPAPPRPADPVVEVFSNDPRLADLAELGRRAARRGQRLTASASRPTRLPSAPNRWRRRWPRVRPWAP